MKKSHNPNQISFLILAFFYRDISSNFIFNDEWGVIVHVQTFMKEKVVVLFVGPVWIANADSHLPACEHAQVHSGLVPKKHKPLFRVTEPIRIIKRWIASMLLSILIVLNCGFFIFIYSSHKKIAHSPFFEFILCFYTSYKNSARYSLQKYWFSVEKNINLAMH